MLQKEKKIGTLWRTLVGRQRSESQDTKLDQAESMPGLQTLPFMCLTQDTALNTLKGAECFPCQLG